MTNDIKRCIIKGKYSFLRYFYEDKKYKEHSYEDT